MTDRALMRMSKCPNLRRALAGDERALAALARLEAALMPDKPQGWPDTCGNCGASWEHIGFDYADGFNCRVCGACDSDE